MMHVDNSKTNGPSKVTIIFCLSLKHRMERSHESSDFPENCGPFKNTLSRTEACNVSYIEDLTKIHRFRAQGRRVNDPEKRQSHWVER